ncbi:MAG: FKBP-type peptidyl-prolyl cis-trans isomerase, partial [Chitinophagaceae bacterium]
MKKNVWTVIFLVGIAGLMSSCAKQNTGCQSVAPATERKQMDSFCVANSINYTEHSSGLMYQIINPGSGLSVNQNSIIYVTYTGMLLNKTVFDSQTDPSRTGFYMSNIIDGWKIGLSLIKKGG